MNMNMNMNNESTNMFSSELGVAKVNNFAEVYPYINWEILNKPRFDNSRDGKVKEVLDFKTQLLNPYRRCVGGYKRNINIFFLLAEAMWIATGRKDVEFLKIFNKKMEDFSDDKKTFHAPYGYRLRHWGVRTEDSFVKEGLNASKGYDQVTDAIRIFTEDRNTRQVVLSIWNPNFDLGYQTKDIPCNDIIMLKIRNNKLITTVQNRSNDLHWGLPTNIFQFSFLTEIIAGTLVVTLGTQTHNSQSLHIYDWNEIATRMNDIFLEEKMKKNIPAIGSLYNLTGVQERKMDFTFDTEIPVNRFHEVEYNLNIIIDNLMRIWNNEEVIKDQIEQLSHFSSYLFDCFQLLKIYLEYKKEIKKFKDDDIQKDEIKMKAMCDIDKLDSTIKEVEKNYNFIWDISLLAKNFFAARLHNKLTDTILGNL